MDGSREFVASDYKFFATLVSCNMHIIFNVFLGTVLFYVWVGFFFVIPMWSCTLRLAFNFIVFGIMTRSDSGLSPVHSGIWTQCPCAATHRGLDCSAVALQIQYNFQDDHCLLLLQ